ncbi:hypothetical protein L2E82_08438 [Cichorium intybus]|uniref:Uncharacterized protein n=1 Tax=Cichorium intybus TaxID=13427 RepID=A0ACB9G6G9_CICIN|nr:hypothetical protein L2E82_08438 [Cichorium intybus]
MLQCVTLSRLPLPRKTDFSLDVQRITEVIEHEKPKIIFLTSPNNPDGSKRAGLAGLRVGYGAFPLSIIEYLWRAKQPYNVSVSAELSACAALQNPTYLEVTAGRDAKKLKEDLAKMGVMIRHYSNKELKGYVRVTVGKPDQTDALMDCLTRLS